MSKLDLPYNIAKFRRGALRELITNCIGNASVKRLHTQYAPGRILLLLLIVGFAYHLLVHTRGAPSLANGNGRFREYEVSRMPLRVPSVLRGEIASSDESSTKYSDTGAAPDWQARQRRVKDSFIHAWSGYRSYAMGYDELLPLTKRGINDLGGLGATIVDALDTAIIMGVDEVVHEATTWIEKHLPQRIDGKGHVNLFETTVHIIGGLLSAYHLSGGGRGVNASVGGTSNNAMYLENARNLADHLLLAFTSSPSAIPFNDVDLHGHSAHPTSDGLSSTAQISALQLEFNYLSSAMGNPMYSLHSMKVLEHIRTLPKIKGLVPVYISPRTGEFNGQNLSLGPRGGSYYEYLMKVWLQNEGGNLTFLHDMYTEAVKGVKELLVWKSVPNGLVFVGELPHGPRGAFSPKMDHLVCFLPGILALGATKGLTKERAMREKLLTFEDLENLHLAEDLAKTCFTMYSVTSTGLSPETVHFNIASEGSSNKGNKKSEYVDDITIKPSYDQNLLRPETIESLFVLFRITGNPKYRCWGWQIFESFEKYSKVDSGGYTCLEDVTVLPPHKGDKMETCFCGGTLKYLYLLFGETSVLPLDQYVFNTEAHPFPIRRKARIL